MWLDSLTGNTVTQALGRPHRLPRRWPGRDRFQRGRAHDPPDRPQPLAGSDQGGVHWGVIASLIETCKLNAVDPQAYLEDVLSRLLNRHPTSQIDQLMPWAYAQADRVA